MNDKDIFYLFIKNAEVVINAYKEYASSNQECFSKCDEYIKRHDFDVVYNESEKYINKNYHSEYAKRYPYLLSYTDFIWEEKGFEKYGIFAYKPLYKNALWTIGVIEKYKEKLVWLLLFEFSDIEFSEEIIRKYDDFIPWVLIEISEYNKLLREIWNGDDLDCVYEKIPFLRKVHKPFTLREGTTFDEGVSNGKTLSNFLNIGFLSTEFIISNLYRIDIRAFCTTAKFEMTKELFYEIYMNVEICNEYSSNPSDKQIGYKCLCQKIVSNPRISISTDTIWYIASELKAKDWHLLLYRIEKTADNLLKFYTLDPKSLEVYYKLNFDERKQIMSIIRENKTLYNTISIDYYKRLYQGGDLIEQIMSFNKTETRIESSELPYAYDFSIESIKDNIKKWNKRAYSYLAGRYRELDTTYQYVKWCTIWELLAKQNTIFLTYDLCKYLIKIDIVKGGRDEIDYDTYKQYEIEEDSLCNALNMFQWLNVKDDYEYNKIINDPELVNFFFSNTYKPKYSEKYKISPILNRLISDFFTDFSFDDFKDIFKKK